MADDDNTRSYRSGAPFPRGSSSHAGGQGGDPLAELARLIGQHDPFADLGRGALQRDQSPAARDPAPTPPPQSDWRSARETPAQDRYQEQPAEDYPSEFSNRNHTDRDYSDQNYSAQNYPSQDYESQRSYSEQDYPAPGSSAHGGYQAGYSDRGHGSSSDARYGDQESYRSADDPQHPSGHYDDRARFDSYGHRQDYGDQGYDNFTPDPQGRYDQSYAPQGGTDEGGYQDPRYFGQERAPADGEDGAYDEPPRSRGRGGIITVAAVLALAMVGTAGAFAYRSYFGGTGSPPPVIRADAGPNKVVPATQGDSAPTKVAQERFVDRSQGERVVSREETPIQFNEGGVRSVTPRVVPPGSGPSGLPSNATSLAPTNGTAGSEPRRIRTVPIRPDQQASADPFAQQRNDAAQGSRGVPPSRAPAAVAPRPAAPAPTSSGPVPLTPQGDTGSLPSVASRAPAPPPVRAATDTSGYFVQLSAQRSEDEAESSFRAMQAKFPNLLGNRQAVIRRKDVTGKGTFFGAQVGPFASREEAGQLCDSLKSQGGTCLVQKN